MTEFSPILKIQAVTSSSPVADVSAPLSRMAALKQATSAAHKHLEQRLELFHADFSLADYQRLLEAFWGYYYPLEKQLMALDELKAALPDWPARAKLPWIIADLRILTGGKAAALPICPNIPPCENLANALGCLYVLEGATLGGQVISRHLKRTFNLGPTNGAAFFNGYGAETDSRWQIFREWMMTAEVEEAPLIQSACATFLTLDQWLMVQFFPISSVNNQ
jgi:heme oxygenase (biliverdin-IX-beta and delta-forming)